MTVLSLAFFNWLVGLPSVCHEAHTADDNADTNTQSASLFSLPSSLPTTTTLFKPPFALPTSGVPLPQLRLHWSSHPLTITSVPLPPVPTEHLSQQLASQTCWLFQPHRRRGTFARLAAGRFSRHSTPPRTTGQSVSSLSQAAVGV